MFIQKRERFGEGSAASVVETIRDFFGELTPTQILTGSTLTALTLAVGLKLSSREVVTVPPSSLKSVDSQVASVTGETSRAVREMVDTGKTSLEVLLNAVLQKKAVGGLLMESDRSLLRKVSFSADWKFMPMDAPVPLPHDLGLTDFYSGEDLLVHVNGEILFLRYYTDGKNGTGYYPVDQQDTVHRIERLRVGERAGPAEFLSAYAANLGAVYRMGEGMKRGDNGPNVIALKNILTAMGLATGHLSEQFDEYTETALKAFQKSQHLGASGTLDTFTIIALEEGIKEALLTLNGKIEAAQGILDHVTIKDGLDAERLFFLDLPFLKTLETLFRKFPHENISELIRTVQENTKLYRRLIRMGKWDPKKGIPISDHSRRIAVDLSLSPQSSAIIAWLKKEEGIQVPNVRHGNQSHVHIEAPYGFGGKPALVYDVDLQRMKEVLKAQKILLADREVMSLLGTSGQAAQILEILKQAD